MLIKEDTHKKYVSTHQTHNDMEAMWIQIGHTRPMFLGLVYGQQENASRSEVEDEYSCLSTELQRITKVSNKIILLGDFNAKLATHNASQLHASRNGLILRQFIDENNLKVMNDSPKCKGFWTREHQHNSNQKSVIDYVLHKTEMEEHITSMIIHDDGSHKLKSDSSHSDHIMIELDITVWREHNTKQEKKKVWKINKLTNWDAYAERLSCSMSHLNRLWEESPHSNKTINSAYEETTQAIATAARGTIGEYTIKPQTDPTRRDPGVKASTEMRKRKKKGYADAIKTKNTALIQTSLNQYITAQEQAREAIKEAERKRAQLVLESIASVVGRLEKHTIIQN